MLQPSKPDLTGFGVRPMKRGDLATVTAIEADIYEFPWSRGNFVDSLVAGYDAWVFERDAAVIGYAVQMWAVDEVHLLNFSIARSWQGQGLGATALKWLLGDVSSKNARGIYLEVRPSNPVARRLYAAHGFRQIGQRKRYYPAAGNTREDALVLICEFKR